MHHLNLYQGNIMGNFLDQFERGYNYGDANSLSGLATMAAFLQGPEGRTTSIEAFEFSVNDFINKFTNYGCYCWILGADKGVIGGGQTRDQIDGLCGQLYKCYKCLNLDFGSDRAIFDYDVSLVAHDNGSRRGSNNSSYKSYHIYTRRVSDRKIETNPNKENWYVMKVIIKMHAFVINHLRRSWPLLINNVRLTKQMEKLTRRSV